MSDEDDIIPCTPPSMTQKSINRTITSDILPKTPPRSSSPYISTNYLQKMQKGTTKQRNKNDSVSKNVENILKSQANDMFKALLGDPEKRMKVLEFLTKQGLASGATKSQEEKAKEIRIESPSGLMRRRELQKLNSGSSSSDDSKDRTKEKSLFQGVPKPFNELLKGVTAYCEVRGKDGDRSEGIKAMMKLMGATILDTFTRNVTHVVFKDGSFTTFQKAKLLKVHLVSVLWLEAVRKHRFRVPESKYPALHAEAYDADVSLICQALQEDYDDIVNDEYKRQSEIKEKGNTPFVTERKKRTQHKLKETLNLDLSPSDTSRSSSPCFPQNSAASKTNSIENDFHPLSSSSSGSNLSSWNEKSRKTMSSLEDDSKENHPSEKNLAVYIKNSLELQRNAKFRSPSSRSTSSLHKIDLNKNSLEDKDDSSIRLHITTSDESHFTSTTSKPRLSSQNWQNFPNRSSSNSTNMSKLKLSSDRSLDLLDISRKKPIKSSRHTIFNIPQQTTVSKKSRKSTKTDASDSEKDTPIRKKRYTLGKLPEPNENISDKSTNIDISLNTKNTSNESEKEENFAVKSTPRKRNLASTSDMPPFKKSPGRNYEKSKNNQKTPTDQLNLVDTSDSDETGVTKNKKTDTVEKNLEKMFDQIPITSKTSDVDRKRLSRKKLYKTLNDSSDDENNDKFEQIRESTRLSKTSDDISSELFQIRKTPSRTYTRRRTQNENSILYQHIMSDPVEENEDLINKQNESEHAQKTTELSQTKKTNRRISRQSTIDNIKSQKTPENNTNLPKTTPIRSTRKSMLISTKNTAETSEKHHKDNEDSSKFVNKTPRRRITRLSSAIFDKTDEENEESVSKINKSDKKRRESVLKEKRNTEVDKKTLNTNRKSDSDEDNDSENEENVNRRDRKRQEINGGNKKQGCEDIENNKKQNKLDENNRKQEEIDEMNKKGKSFTKITSPDDKVSKNREKVDELGKNGDTDVDNKKQQNNVNNSEKKRTLRRLYTPTDTYFEKFPDDWDKELQKTDNLTSSLEVGNVFALPNIRAVMNLPKSRSNKKTTPDSSKKTPGRNRINKINPKLSKVLEFDETDTNLEKNKTKNKDKLGQEDTASTNKNSSRNLDERKIKIGRKSVKKTTKNISDDEDLNDNVQKRYLDKNVDFHEDKNPDKHTEQNTQNKSTDKENLNTNITNENTSSNINKEKTIESVNNKNLTDENLNTKNIANNFTEKDADSNILMTPRKSTRITKKPNLILDTGKITEKTPKLGGKTAKNDVFLTPGPVRTKKKTSKTNKSFEESNTDVNKEPGKILSENVVRGLSKNIGEHFDTPRRSRRISSATPRTYKNDVDKSFSDDLRTRNQSSDELNSSSEPRRSTLDFVKKPSRESLQRIRATQKSKAVNSKLSSIVCTRLHRAEVENFEKVVEELGGFFIENNVSNRTTHLIAGAPSRTMNVLRALARGCWILRTDWLQKSFENGKWLPEEEFEMIEFSPAVQKCRMEKQAFGPLYSMDIFKEIGPIYVSRKSIPKYTDLEELVTLCGGKIVKIPRQAKVIVGEICRYEDVQCVSERWVLDSVTNNKKKSLKSFLIPSRTSNEF